MWRGPFLPAVLLALPALGNACSIESRRAGEPFDVPASMVEVRVLDLADEPYEYRKGRFTEGQRARFEVVRSLIGSMPVGTTFERHYMTDGCFGNRLARDTFDSVLGRFSYATPAWRGSARPTLADVRLSGDIDDAVAERLLKQRSRAGRRFTRARDLRRRRREMDRSAALGPGGSQPGRRIGSEDVVMPPLST